MKAPKLTRRLLLWLVLAPLALLLLLQLYFFVCIWWWVDHNPGPTSFMRRQLSVLQEKNPNAVLQQKWVPYDRISNNLKRAIIASEDANFSEHEGVDWEALQKAYEKNNRKGKVVAGGSTITQQLAKNLVLVGSAQLFAQSAGIRDYLYARILDGERADLRDISATWWNGATASTAPKRRPNTTTESLPLP